MKNINCYCRLDYFNSNAMIINGNQVSLEEFKEQFSLGSMTDFEKFSYRPIKEQDGVIYNESISIDDLDFGSIEW